MKISETNILSQLDKVIKEKKQKINVKQKGKRGESWFADVLSTITGKHFQRIYTSGAAVGRSNNTLLEQLTQSQAEAQLGDIQSPEMFKHLFIWECKNYADLDFHNLINPIGKFSKKVKDWIIELEFDLQSAFSKMKNNIKPVMGFLCIKITRKGAWIVGNYDYLIKNFTNIYVDNVLFFVAEPNEYLKRLGFSDKYFMTDFETFINNNKNNIFIIDLEKEEKYQKAMEIIKSITHI